MPIRRPRLAAWLPWVALAGLVAVLTILAPGRRTVLPVYHGGVERFFAGETLHEEGIYGFLYLPAFALVFGPFHALPGVAGDVLWRLVGLLLLASGVRGFVRRLAPAHADRAFLLAGLLALAGSWSAARNGQANLWIGALILHAALALADGRRARAAAVLAFALAVKPIAVVPLLLFGALDRGLAWRLVVGLVVVFALPFAFADPAFVWEQHVGFAEKMVRANAPPKPYTEAFGGLELLGWSVPQAARQVVRVAMALATLLVCLGVRRRHGLPAASLAAAGLAAAYLMAFNPVTEANGYVILAAVACAHAAAAWTNGRRLEGAWLGCGCVLLGTHLLGGAVHAATRRWFKPLLALLFWLHVTLRSLAGPAGRGPAATPRAARPATAG